MEKRLFLAVILSVGVVFCFQSFFGSKQQATTSSTNPVAGLVSGTDGASSGKIPTIGTTDTVTDAAHLDSFKEETITVEAGPFSLDISNNGGAIKRMALKELKYDFPVSGLIESELFSGKIFTYNKIDKNSFTLVHESKSWTVVKKVAVNGYKISISYQITNNLKTPQSADLNVKPFEIDLSRLDNKASQSDWTLFEYAFKTDKKIERKEHASNFSDKWNKQEDSKIEWLSFRDRYFVTIVASENDFKGFSAKSSGSQSLAFKALTEAVIIDAGSTIERKYTAYAGPQRLDLLKEARPGFEKVLVFSSWGWLDAIAKAIYWLLGAVHNILPSWGLCIIIVSLIVYGIMYPLTLKSMISMKKMQSVQPKMAQLKEKYKNNSEKLNKEIVELYRVEGINPLSGCLPLLLQMPIFVGLYQVLWRSIYFRGEGFLWMKDLSMPDRLFKLPLDIPFLGSYFNILPIVMMGVMFVQQSLTMKSMTGGDPEQVAQQKMMATLMPIILGIVFYNFSCGLNLYFVVFYSLSAVSQWNIGRSVKVVS